MRHDRHARGGEHDRAERVRAVTTARLTDPDTSHEAAALVAPWAGTQQARVLAVMARMIWASDDRLIAVLPDMVAGSVIRRRGELRDRGLVRDSGVRTVETPHRIVWQITPAGLDVAERAQ